MSSTSGSVTSPQPGTSTNKTAIQSFDTTHSPAGLWNFNEDLTDESGNGLDLTMEGTDTSLSFADIHPGKKGLQFKVGQRVRLTGAQPDLLLQGDLTMQMIFRFDEMNAGTSQFLFIYGGDAELLAENTQYEWLMLGAGTSFPLTVDYFHEHGNGVNDNHTFPSGFTLPSVGKPVLLGLTRISNVCQWYMNGRAMGAPSATLTAPAGGAGPDMRFGIGGFPGFSGSVHKWTCAGAKIIGSGLSDAQMLAEYNRTMGQAFGELT